MSSLPEMSEGRGGQNLFVARNEWWWWRWTAQKPLIARNEWKWWWWCCLQILLVVRNEWRDDASKETDLEATREGW